MAATSPSKRRRTRLASSSPRLFRMCAARCTQPSARAMSGHSAAVPPKPRVISWRNRVSRGEPPPFPHPVQARGHLLQPPLERQARGGEGRGGGRGRRAPRPPPHGPPPPPPPP